MNNQSSRRNFLKATGTTLLFTPAAASIIGCRPIKAAVSSSSISPKSPGKSSNLILNIKDFGAIGDGQTKDTTVIQQTIDRCSVLGGGEVLIPAGNYLTGALALRSNVIIRFEKDAVILGSADFADYPVSQVRWEGKWIQGHVGLFYAFKRQQYWHYWARQNCWQPCFGRQARQ